MSTFSRLAYIDCLSRPHRLVAALTAIDEALVMLEDAGAANNEDKVDLLDLSEALVVELERRTMEDAEYRVQAAGTHWRCRAGM